MQKVARDGVERVPHLMGINSERRPMSRSVEDIGFAVVDFELDPGEAFSGALHKHTGQEELFYVIEGTATFEVRETADAESEYVEVGPDELIHFAKDDVYQTGGNQTEEPVRAIALGVPGARHDWEQTEAVVECSACGRETPHSFLPIEGVEDVRMPAPDEMRITCTECGNEA